MKEIKEDFNKWGHIIFIDWKTQNRVDTIFLQFDLNF